MVLPARPILCVAALAPLALTVGCGGDSDVPDDERARQVSGVAELATNAFAAVGPSGLYDYLAQDVAERCSPDALNEALAGEPVPEGFKRIDNVQLDGSEARADVIQLFGEEERAVQWSFVLEDEQSWRITGLPGLDACES
jgi:hypothetical protein